MKYDRFVGSTIYTSFQKSSEKAFAYSIIIEGQFDDISIVEGITN